MEISLARVLKIKKILAGKLSAVQMEIQIGNSVYFGAEQADIKKLLEQRNNISKHLIDLKNVQYNANLNIQRTLIELAESKSTLSFWKSVNTTSGETGQVYSGTSQKVVMNAVIKKDEKAAIVEDLEKNIEELQEKIDQYNYSTKISVSEDLMKAAGLRR